MKFLGQELEDTGLLTKKETVKTTQNSYNMTILIKSFSINVAFERLIK